MTKFLRCARRVSNYGCRGASAGRTRSRTRRGNMPRGGSKPGERRGGRKKGSLSEATIERALKAERELVNANETGKSSPVENIERVIEEEPDLSVPDACKKAMAEITGPILAITFVLLSVFVLVGAPTHVPARLRLSACQPGHRHAHPAGVSRPSQHPAHRALH
jgi:hypothetical protein